MATIAANDIVKFRWYATLGQQASVITHYYEVDPVTLVGNWTDSFLLNQWAVAVAPVIKPLLANVAHFDGSSIQIVTQKPYSALLYSSQGAGAGTMTSNPVPTQVCGMISRKTNYAGRRYQGRLFMPFFTVTGVDTNGLPAITYSTLLQNFVAAAEPIAGMGLSGSGLTIKLMPWLFHKTSLGTAGTNITGHEYPLKFGTQHRRGSYGRPNFSPPMMVPSLAELPNTAQLGRAAPLHTQPGMRVIPPK